MPMKSEAQSGFVNIVVFGYWYSMSYNDELRSSYIKSESKEEVQLCTDIQVGIQKCPVFRKEKAADRIQMMTWTHDTAPCHQLTMKTTAVLRNDYKDAMHYI